MCTEACEAELSLRCLQPPPLTDHFNTLSLSLSRSVLPLLEAPADVARQRAEQRLRYQLPRQARSEVDRDLGLAEGSIVDPTTPTNHLHVIERDLASLSERYWRPFHHVRRPRSTHSG
jgi:hypothetical protein